MTAIEILNKWAEYSKYDPDQHTFNLLSSNYLTHQACDAIQSIMEYDPTGMIGALYAKHAFFNICQQLRVSLFDILKDPDDWREDKEMWDIFASEDLQVIEDGFLNLINQVVMKVIPVKQIGNRNVEQERESLYGSIEAVVENLSHCRVDLFLKGGPIQPIRNFSTHIYAFERIAECLLAIEQAPDGMYLCYIKNYGTADGWFGFFIKSNGTILSVNERVNERYPGQHANSRNGRWSDDKKYHLFPYQFIFNFTEHDYKGYASKHIIQDDRLAFFELEAKAYMPLILAMVMLNTKYQGQDVSDIPVQYVDSLLKINISAIPAGQETALVVPQNSAIAAINRGLEISFDNASVIEGSAGEKFARELHKDGRYEETGTFPQKENIFVKLYGADFQLDTTRLLEADPHIKALPADKRAEETPNPEFVGTETRMELLAYQQARTQLAAYIRNKMFEEFMVFGGARGVRDWFRSTVVAHKDAILDLCAEKYRDSKTVPFIRFSEEPYGVRYFNNLVDQKYTINPPTSNWKSKISCPITGAAATQFFRFQFKSWEELAMVFGEANLPKIVLGWMEDREGIGNSLLDVVDPVWSIGTPMEDREINQNQRLWTVDMWKRKFWQEHDMDSQPPEGAFGSTTQCRFEFSVGLSKRGLAQLLKHSS